MFDPFHVPLSPNEWASKWTNDDQKNAAEQRKSIMNSVSVFQCFFFLLFFLFVFVKLPVLSVMQQRQQQQHQHANNLQTTIIWKNKQKIKRKTAATEKFKKKKKRILNKKSLDRLLFVRNKIFIKKFHTI